MLELRITIDLDNAAFEPDPGHEVRRILKELAHHWVDGQKIKDINGNTVGRVEVLD